MKEQGTEIFGEDFLVREQLVPNPWDWNMTDKENQDHWQHREQGEEQDRQQGYCILPEVLNSLGR